MAEKTKRSVVKTITWRIIASATTILLVYVITKKIVLSLGVGLIEFIVKLLLYFFHERIWNKVPWGREK